MSGPTLIPERSFRFRYETTIEGKQSDEDPVDVWIPVSRSDAFQTIGALEVRAPLPYEEAIEPTSGNRMIHVRIPQRFGEVTIAIAYDVSRLLRRVDPPQPGTPSENGLDALRYRDELAPNAKVPIDGFIGEQARRIAAERDPPVVKARKIFDHLIGTLQYDRGGCTPDRAHELGNLAQACDLRRGTCTEFHGLLVGYARALGVPAKFVFGFNIPMDRSSGSIAGYHCWCEVLLPPAGWCPIDVTEAMKAKARGEELTEFFFGGLHAHRVQVSTGRDILLVPRQQGPRVDKLIFSHAEAGGRKIDPRLSFFFSEAAGDHLGTR